MCVKILCKKNKNTVCKNMIHVKLYHIDGKEKKSLEGDDIRKASPVEKHPKIYYAKCEARRHNTLPRRGKTKPRRGRKLTIEPNRRDESRLLYAAYLCCIYAHQVEGIEGAFFMLLKRNYSSNRAMELGEEIERASFCYV